MKLSRIFCSSSFFIGKNNNIPTKPLPLQPADAYKPRFSGGSALVINGHIIRPGAQLAEANLAGADLRKANLTKIDFTDAILNEAKFNGATLNGAQLVRAKLKGADFTGAKANRPNVCFLWADMTGATLHNVDLSHASLSEATCIRANFNGAKLSSSYLIGTNLSEASCKKAQLKDVNFTGAKFIKADLSGATLTGDMTDANLSHANLTGSTVLLTKGGRDLILEEANFKNAKIAGDWSKVSVEEMKKAKWNQAQYRSDTVFPIGFDPKKAGLTEYSR